MKPFIHGNKEYAFVTFKDGKSYYRSIEDKKSKDQKIDEIEVEDGKAKKVKIKDKINGKI